MGFTADTKIFTSRGWKYIRDISGRDRILVRNFLGDAEFIQPFALRKKHYDGEVVKFGGKYWATTVTPDHNVIFDNETVKASDIKVDKNKRLHRRFRYLREDRGVEKLHIKNGDSTRQVTLSDETWYTLVAYTITKGYISKDRNPRLKFMLNVDNFAQIVVILDNLGITYSAGDVKGSLVITVNRDNNLARKLKVFLSARARRDMVLPDKMVYGSSQALIKHFLDTVTYLIAKPSVTRPNQLTFTFQNPKLLETIKMMCMFCGYGFAMTPVNGTYSCYIIKSGISSWSVRFIEKYTYTGYTYEIDLFDGLVYVTERSLPVWMSPK